MKLRKILLTVLMVMVAVSVMATDVELYRQCGYLQQEKAFDHVEKISYVALTPTNVITPTDIVSTNTASVYYLTDSPTYPISLEVQNHSSASVTYNIYSTSATTGVDVPGPSDTGLFDGNGASCVTEKTATFIFYQAPNISFSSAGTAKVTFTVRSRLDY